MKQFLKKRWHHIPVGIVSALLALVLVAGGAFAWYQVTTGTANVTVVEAITIANVGGDDGNFYWDGNVAVWNVPAMYPGEMKVLYIEVSSASSADLDVVATYTISPAGEGITVTGNAGIALDIPVTISGGTSGVFAIEVYAAGDATPGLYTINFELHRK